jgi:hypothetical protein
MLPFSLEQMLVKAGDIIRIGPWNYLMRAIRSIRLIAGEDCRLRETPDGTIINFSGGNFKFLHPFKVSLEGDSGVKVRPGMVETKMPFIKVDGKEVPLDGGADKDFPTLTWKEPKLNEDKRGWVAVEVRLKPDSYEIDKVEVVQVKELQEEGMDPRIGRHPIAMLLKKKDGTLKCFQTSHFSLKYYPKVNPTTKAIRHFFRPS